MNQKTEALDFLEQGEIKVKQILLIVLAVTLMAGVAFGSPPIEISSPWSPGQTWDAGGSGYYYGESSTHDGDDYYCIDFNRVYGDDDNQPILAVAAGTVVSYGNDEDGYGNYIWIQHAENCRSLYAHLKYTPLVTSGSVYKGQQIGNCGSTGLSTSSHLHFGLYQWNSQLARYVSIEPSPMDGQTITNGADLISKNYSYQISSQSPKDASGFYELSPGEEATFWVDVHNTSPAESPAWNNTNGTAGYVELKCCNLDGSPNTNGWLYHPTDWINSSRVTTMNNSQVTGDGYGRFEFQVKVPVDAEPGVVYNNWFRVLHATGGWMQDWGGLNFPVKVVSDDLTGDNFIAFVGNFNGDNKADIGLWDTENGDWYIALRDPNGNRFIPDPDPWLEGWADGSGYKLIIADFSGDGYDEICVYHYATGRWFVAYNQGDHFSSATGPYTYGSWLTGWATGNSTAYIPMVGKYNNDALFDIAVFHPGTGRWFVAYNSGSESFSSQGLWLDDWGDGSYGTYWPFTGKLNTDAYYDVGCYHPGTGRWFGAYRSGSNFSPSGGIWLDSWATGSSTTWKNFFGKSSSDSYDDIIVYKPSEGKWCVAYNWNGYFAQANGADYQNSWLYGWAVEDGYLQWQTFAQDVSGDGYVDLIAYTPKYGRWFVAYNWAGPPPYFNEADGLDDYDSWLNGWGIESGGSAKLAEDESLEGVLPSVFTLNQNYPNPFNPATTISYSLPAASDVKIDIFNILGQKVETLVNGPQEAGEHSVTWNANRVSSGVYFYRISTNEAVESKKMLLLK